MSKSINRVTLIGNVGQDPEVQKTASGSTVAHFSLATNRRIPKGDDFEDRTEWHRLTLWNKLAELAQEYIRKGDRLYIEGRLEYSSYEKDGVTIPTTDITVRELVMLGSPGGQRGRERATGARVGQEGARAAPGPFDDDDGPTLPF